MPARKYATTDQVDKMHDCLDKFKTETKVNSVRLDERCNSIEKLLETYHNESRDDRAIAKSDRDKMYTKMNEIAADVAANKAVDEERDRKSRAVKPSSPKPVVGRNAFDIIALAVNHPWKSIPLAIIILITLLLTPGGDILSTIREFFAL